MRQRPAWWWWKARRKKWPDGSAARQSGCGREGKKVGIIATEETRASYPDVDVKVAGTRADESTVAGSLYGILREFDADGVDAIYSEAFDPEGIGTAVMNRLLKAAGHQVVRIPEEA